MTNLDYHEPVSKLLTLGDGLGIHQWPDYLALGIGPEHVPELIRMMQDDELNQADSDRLEVWAPVHAWRALGQLRAEAAIEPLIGLLERIDEDYEEWIGEEVPQVLGLIGPAAMPRLSECLFTPHEGIWAQSLAGNALAEIGKRHPEVRGECVATLSRALEGFASQDRELNAFFIGNLIDLKAVEAASLMEEAFAANRVDLFISGDWEGVQIQLGLLEERQTPVPDYVQLPVLLGPEGRQSTQVVPDQQRKEERRAAHYQRDKRKAQRKQQKQARRKQQKRK
jgi:hypothetical protein